MLGFTMMTSRRLRQKTDMGVVKQVIRFKLRTMTHTNAVADKW